MFKKFLSIVMVVAIFTVSAHASSNQGLKAAFDELNYALTVDWDQKDQAFYQAQMKKFSASLKDLQSKGMTNAQLIEFVKSEVKDEKVSRDIQTALTMISLNKMSSSEAAEHMSNTMKNAYTKGASWNGGVSVLLAIGVVAILVAVALAAPVRGGGGGYCSDVYVCDTYCYNDYYWGYTCEDDCYYSCY